MKKYIIKISKKLIFIRLIYNFFRINLYFFFGYHFFYLKRIFCEKKMNSNFHLLDKKKLINDGLIIKNNFFDKKQINLLSLKFNKLIEDNFEKFKFSLHPQIEKKELIKNSINHLNVYKYTNYITLPNPLLYFPEVIILIKNNIINIINEYFEVRASLTGINLRRSFANNLPQMGTQNYHSDENSINFLKCFIYLTNVTEKNGPFTFVIGSHAKKKIFDEAKYHYTDSEIKNKYGNSAIKFITGSIGDLVIANTKGYHKGTKLLEGYRDMLTLHFGIHNEYLSKKNAPRVNDEIISLSKKMNLNFLDLAKKI